MNLIAYDDDSILLLRDEGITQVIAVGAQGPAGISGDSGLGNIELEFAWNDVTTVNLSTIPADKLILSVQIFITTVFNGTNPALQIGDAGMINRLMDTTQVNPALVSEYSVSPLYQYGVDTQTILTITPGAGASTGAGLVKIKVQA